MNRKQKYRITVSVADVMESATPGDLIGRRESQLLYGEKFIVERFESGLAYGRCAHDAYEGYVNPCHLTSITKPATHFVDNTLTHVYPQPDLHSRPLQTLSFMSRLIVVPKQQVNNFSYIEDKGWVPTSHIKPVSDLKQRIDHVSQALRFAERPYGYAGRHNNGIDCSGLVQISLLRAGFKHIPRDADLQEKSHKVGKVIPVAQIDRGDVVFFKGHVGIMLDPKNVISATEQFMKVAIEPVQDVINRLGPITTARRPAPLPRP
ncbi:MAG: NlpC/P60 family protein [Micavibrio sp.]